MRSAVLYPKNMDAYLVEQQIALKIARGQVSIDIGRSIRADREADWLRV